MAVFLLSGMVTVLDSFFKKRALSLISSRLYVLICSRGKISPLIVFLVSFISLIIAGRIYLCALAIPPPMTTIPSTIFSDSEIVKPAISPSFSKLFMAASLLPALLPSAISKISFGEISDISPESSRYSFFTARILTPSSASRLLSYLLAVIDEDG